MQHKPVPSEDRMIVDIITGNMFLAWLLMIPNINITDFLRHGNPKSVSFINRLI
jgi:hypothetical protein